jgi:hypothetical protein
MIQKVEWGLANVPLWAFPTTDSGWDMLRDMPLYHYSTWLSNNNPDSRYEPFDAGRLREVGERLKADGKQYVVTLLDRNWSLTEVLEKYPWLQLIEQHDDTIRDRLLAPLGGGDFPHRGEVLGDIVRYFEDAWDIWNSNVLHMLWNGAEGKRNEIPNGHQFDWGAWDVPRVRRAWEIILSQYLPVTFYGAFHHRYFHSYGWHNHSNVVLRRTAWENFTEVGVHANLGDDFGGLQRLFTNIAKELAGDTPEYGYNMTRRKKARIFVHGVIHLPVGLTEVERVDAWSRAGARKVAKRDEYFGLLAGKHATEVEMLLAKTFAKGAIALQELLP